MLRFGERNRLRERLEEPLPPSAAIVRHERDPMSGWIMAFMVLVVLVGLGFISLMDLSAQQTKTERTLFQVQQELRRSHNLAAQPLSTSDMTHENVYSQLNSDIDGAEIDALPPSTSTENTTTTTTTTTTGGAEAPVAPPPAAETDDGKTPVPGVPQGPHAKARRVDVRLVRK